MRAVRDLKSCCHQRSLCPQIDEGDFQSIALRCGCYACGTQNIILYVFDVPFLDGKDLRSVPLDTPIACAAAALPRHHRDPFDRVLVALARANALTVLTSDEHIPKYEGMKTIW